MNGDKICRMKNRMIDINELKKCGKGKKYVGYTPYLAIVVSVLFFLFLSCLKQTRYIGILFLVIIFFIVYLSKNKQHLIFFEKFFVVFLDDSSFVYKIDYDDIESYKVKKNNIGADLFCLNFVDGGYIEFETFKSYLIARELKKQNKNSAC